MCSALSSSIFNFKCLFSPIVAGQASVQLKSIGKPSTWFPIEGPVQKGLAGWLAGWLAVRLAGWVAD